MNNRLFLAVALSATAMTGVAIAAQQPPAAPAQATKAPRNADRVVTREQALARADAGFDRLDVNRDGQVTADEFQAMRGQRPMGKRGMARLDKDGDGVVTNAERATAKAEQTARRVRMEARMDANGDGTVSAQERAAFREQMRAKRGGDDDARTGRRGQRGAAAFARMDTNGDGTISREEFRAAAVARFDRMDANKDGRIDAAERKASADQMRERHATMRAKRDSPAAVPGN